MVHGREYIEAVEYQAPLGSATSSPRDVDMTGEMLASNLPPAIQQRIQSGHISWTGPLVLTTAWCPFSRGFGGRLVATFPTLCAHPRRFARNFRTPENHAIVSVRSLRFEKAGECPEKGEGSRNLEAMPRGRRSEWKTQRQSEGKRAHRIAS
jgi:hypothetical protein